MITSLLEWAWVVVVWGFAVWVWVALISFIRNLIK